MAQIEKHTVQSRIRAWIVRGLKKWSRPAVWTVVPTWHTL